MNKILTAAEFRESCRKICAQAAAEAAFFCEVTTPDQHRRLYGVQEWYHAADLEMPGISNPYVPENGP